jgi:hypothetical protein
MCSFVHSLRCLTEPLFSILCDSCCFIDKSIHTIGKDYGYRGFRGGHNSHRHRLPLGRSPGDSQNIDRYCQLGGKISS